MKKKKKATINKKKNTMLEYFIRNRKLNLISLIALILAIYCIYKVVALVKNPTDTFSVEQGKIYQEESTTRVYY